MEDKKSSQEKNENQKNTEKHILDNDENAKKEKIAEHKDKAASPEIEEIKRMRDCENQLENFKRMAEERLEQLKYLHADFDNYRKRLEKEKESIIRLANENLVKELLILLDDFESSLKLIEDDKNKQGLEMLHRKFLHILEQHGLKRIESLGKKFDPYFHEVLCKEICERNDNEILEEIQKGYLFCSKVIRPTKVKISEKIKNKGEDKKKESKSIENEFKII